MVQGFSQNQNIQPQNRTAEAFQAQNKDEAMARQTDVDESMATIRGAINDIQDEVAGKVKVRSRDAGVGQKDVEEHHTMQQLQQAQPEIESNAEKFQKSTQFNTHDHQEESTTVASQIAGILADEELEKLKKKGGKKSTTLMEKLDILGKLEGDFKLFKFKDPEKQKVVDEFFDNLSRIKNLKKRLNQLEHIEREHEAKKRRDQ